MNSPIFIKERGGYKIITNVVLPGVLEIIVCWTRSRSDSREMKRKT